MDDLISLYFMILAVILLVMLVLLYRLTMAVDRLDRRIDRFARHLQDLNLYDLQPAVPEVFGSETELEGAKGSTSIAENLPAPASGGSEPIEKSS